MACTETTSITEKTARTSLGDVLIGRITVRTHRGGLSASEEAHLFVGGNVHTLGVEEAVKLFDKLPGNRVRVRYEEEDCDDADHDEALAELMESNAELALVDGGRY